MEIVKIILTYIKPKFYNSITWVLVVSGIALTGTSLLEKLINISLGFDSSTNDAISGIILIVLGLCYNILYKQLEYKYEISENKHQQVLKIRNDKTRLCGKLDLTKIQEQNAIESFIGINYKENSFTVRNLPDYFYQFAINNINSKYLTYDSGVTNGQLAHIKQTRFLINSTRISTFLCFTDSENILVYERMESNLQRVQNSRYDCFGSVTFENCTIFLKIDNTDNFYDSNIINLEFIPGLAYEDNFENNKKETVIMFGYIIYLSKENLAKGITTNSKNLKLINICDKNIEDEALTSKLKLAKHFLLKKYS